MCKYFVLFVLFAVFGAHAQTTSTSMLRTVTDPSGAAVPGAEVTATNVRTNQSRRITSNDLGYYILPALDPGEYRLTAQKAGFKTQVRSGIGTKPKHRGTLRALGLGRIGKSNVLPDRPEIRGMIAKVPHLVDVEEVGK